MRCLLILFFIFISPFFLQSQNKGKPISFRHLTIEEGLSQNTILSIAQDSIGYLWFATQNGLNKYNGKSFTHYNKQFQNITRPNYSRLGKVYVDKQNQLWIVSNTGELERYHPKTDSFSAIKTTFSVSTIFQDKSLNLYLGTYNNGIYKIDAKTKDTLQILKEQDTKLTSYHFLEVEDKVYAATSQGVLELRNNSTYNSLKLPSLKGTQASTLEVDASKTIWLGTYGYGLYYKKQDELGFSKFTSLDDFNLPENLNIEDLLIDSQDRLWLATYGSGLYVIDFKLKVIQQYKSQKSNPFAVHYNDILCLFEDSTGNNWLGTDGAGASYFDKHLVKFNLLTNNQLPDDVTVEVIRSITTDKDKNIWLGTSGQGLTFIDLNEGNHITYTTENSKISSNRVVSLANINNEIWIGHQDSGLEIRNASGEYQVFPVIENSTIWNILPDNKNEVWLATENSGVILFSKTKGILKQFNISNSKLASNNIRVIIKSNPHTLWLGTSSDGLFKLDINTNEVTKINAVNGGVKSLYYKGKVLWIGTNGNGLKRLDLATSKVNTFTKEDGLPNEVVYSILPDTENNLWLSTNYGLCKFKLNTEGTVSVENFTNLNGLQGLEFNTGAYFKGNNGVLYFGGLEGVNWFEPQSITKNTIEPQTVITGVDVFNKPVDFSESLELHSDKNTITFTYSGLHFSQPERNLYKYKLENNDAIWTEAGNKNIAHYTNLPPNDYTFQVYSSNYDGAWDKTPANYSFTILKPWYATNFAKFMYLLLIGFSFYFIYAYLKFRWEIKTQLQLEHAETERLTKLDEFKTKLYTNISHEFRTPLTLISGPIDRQLSKPNISKEDEIEFSLIQRNSKRLLNLVNQLLDLSKLESGSLKLNVTKGDLNILLKQICAAFEFKAEAKNIQFICKITPIGEAWYDKDVIEKIATNLLANAIKYTPENGSVSFETALQDGQVVITVVNNGNTISDKQLGRLFQRFYQANKNSDGAGIGLSLVKELCILSHGNIVAHTMNDDDIQFTITLPIEKSYYNQSEIVFEETFPSQVNDDPNVEILNEELIEDHSSQETPVLLIIEDDKDVRQFVKSIFENEYIVLEANNGEKGIVKAISYIPDLIISDIMMPVTDGIAVCNILKEDERTSHIPIILLTAKVGEENEITGLKTGADDYITKPFNSEKLKIRVEKLIQLRRQLQQRYSNELEINPKDIAISSVDQQFLERLQEVLDDSITNSSFNTEEFGDKMLMSRMQLHRKLKALTGLSSSEFLRSQRLKIAIKLLNESDYTVSEIAYEVGFNTPSYFIKCFKEKFKCTPKEYLIRE